MTEKQKDFFDDMEGKLRGLGHKVNQVFEDFVQKKGENKESPDVKVDSYRMDDTLFFHLDLPGFLKENVKIQVLDNQLIIRGHRDKPSYGEKPEWKTQERQFGKYERSFSLPAYAMAEKTKAKFDNGVLTVTIPLDDYEIEEQEIRID